MGTPEFPDLGKHCSVGECRQIDFLPFTCDRCRQVFCLEHRSYIGHRCPNANQNDVTVVICPLCAKGVRLKPNEDPNITWETHQYTECDPSNYEKVNKQKKCPVPGCREKLTFSNTIKCRDCTKEHCLSHRLGSDHKCPGPPKNTSSSFPMISSLRIGQKGERRPSSSNNGSWWGSNLLNAVAGLGEGMLKPRDAAGPSSNGGGPLVEQCPQCAAQFPSILALIEHAERVHQSNAPARRQQGPTIDVCPKCSRGFRGAASLVQHIEREHGGTSRA